MPDIKIWITRPEASELWLGGLRSVQAWLACPRYSHQPHRHWRDDVLDEPFSDLGWHALAFDRSTAVKPLLRQDEGLLERVWQLLIWSAAPRGASKANAEIMWQEKTDEALVLERSSDCHRVGFQPFSDDWESRCNLSHKRLLIEVGLRSGVCRLVAPLVVRTAGAGTTVTTLITPELALQQEHDAEHLRIPF